MVKYKNIALFLEPNSHFLEHLGVFCLLFDLPALFSDPELEKKAKLFFPGLKTCSILPSQLNLASLSQLAENYYIPLYRYSQDFIRLTKILKQKRPRFIYVPHGFSDKIKEQDLLNHAHLDDFFIYGQTEHKLFDKVRIRPSSTYLGNYRSHFFESKKQFYENKVQKEIFDLLPKGRKLLYAPTWEDPRKPTPFFQMISHLLQLLPKNQTLIIKPHPLLYRYELSSMLQVEQKIVSYRNVILLDEYPLVIPILQKVDCLISDHSSVAYDFLKFNKPLYFLLSEETKKSALHECGFIVAKHNLSMLFKPLESNPYFREAKQLYNQTFHKWKSLDEFKDQIQKEHFITA